MPAGPIVGPTPFQLLCHDYIGHNYIGHNYSPIVGPTPSQLLCSWVVVFYAQAAFFSSFIYFGHPSDVPSDGELRSLMAFAFSYGL